MGATAENNHAHGHDNHGHAHHHEESFISKYIFSQDHKMISKQFLITAIFMGIIAVMLSIFFCLQLGWPGESFGILNFFLGDKWAPDGVMNGNAYLAMVTIHGTIRDMASGFLNMLSFWFFLVSSILMVASLFVEGGAASGGWTVYPPLSALPQAMPGSGTGMTIWLISMVLFVASSLLGGLNYIVTIINLRTKGMSMTRLPLTMWAIFVTAILGVLSFPVLVSCVVLLLMDRSFGTAFYLSDIFIDGQPLDVTGGSPILFQHLFWFLGHPEVYIVLLPALGISSEVISTNSRKPIFGYKAMVGSILAIGFLSFIVWGHHMYITGMNPFIGSVFVFTTLLIAIPSAVKAFNYITTLWQGNVRFTPAMLFSIGLVSTFVTGGLTGIILADSALDVNVHDTYFVVAHFHIVMGMSAIFGMLAGIYHWFPKMFGRMMNSKLGYAHFWLTLVCGYGVFFPMHFVGLAGSPRRYYSYSEFTFLDGVQDLQPIISTFAIIGGAAQLLFLFNFFHSIWYGQEAQQNPWGSNTLEWTTPVKHIHGNWPGAIPEVHRWAYDYSNPEHDTDFVPQVVPLKPGEHAH